MKLIIYFTFPLLLLGCAGTSVDNTPGMRTRYVDVQTPDPTGGAGIESQDIASMCDKMMREIINAPQIVNRTDPPLIIIDDEHFVNQSSSRIDKRLITDQLRVELNRIAQGRLYFVSRENIDMVEKERMLKREGVVTLGTLQLTEATAGADFILTGRITSLDGIASREGTQSRYHQITFELINLETGIVTWNGRYEFKKIGRDDVVYR